MKMSKCYNARKALQVAIGKVKATNAELVLNEYNIDEDTWFRILWNLGFELYSELERFRTPDGTMDNRLDRKVVR